MSLARYRLTWSLLAVLLWVLAPVVPALVHLVTGGTIASAPPGGVTEIVDLVSNGIMVNVLIAIGVLVVFALVLRWNDLGFTRPQPWKSLWLLWFPGFYLILFYAAGFAVGLPPLPTLGILFVNTLLVGISEELAFRGILFRGLRSRLGMWPSVIVSSLLFGALHMGNALATGDLLAAVAQALSAVITGTLLVAIVIRTGSIIPAIVLHALWDFGILFAATSAVANAGAADSGGTAAGPEISPWFYFVPVLLNVPNFLYALYLLRRRRTGAAEAPAPVAGAPLAQT